MAQTDSNYNYEKSKNSFINEIRGRLLEFSCGMELCAAADIIDLFYTNISDLQISELQQYQDFLRSHDLLSYEYIQKAGKYFANYYIENINENISNVLLTGKMQSTDNFHEADIAVSMSNNMRDLISLKLIKEDSFINSKSAGIKSIFLKYFNRSQMQNDLNQKVDFEFDQFRLRFFEHFDRSVNDLSFSQLCDVEKISSRPGQLPNDLKIILFMFYKACIDEIYRGFKIIYEEQKDNFLEFLYPLIGFGDEAIKVMAFVHNRDFSNMNMSYHKISDVQSRMIKIHEVSGNSSFLIELDKLYLQIRVKPMNSFLAPSMKINCSIKFKSK